jgi:3-oxoacyl-[acyl-carrier-protein] synthase-3
MEKVFLNLHRYGNVSAASVAIGLDEVFQKNELARRDKVLLAAIGAGLSWAAAVIEW